MKDKIKEKEITINKAKNYALNMLEFDIQGIEDQIDRARLSIRDFELKKSILQFRVDQLRNM